MHGHNSAPGMEAHLLNLAPIEFQLGTNGTDTTLWFVVVFVGIHHAIRLMTGCSKHIPGAYLELAFAPTPLDELQAPSTGRSMGHSHLKVQCGFGLVLQFSSWWSSTPSIDVKAKVDKREGFDSPPLSRTLTP